MNSICNVKSFAVLSLGLLVMACAPTEQPAQEAESVAAPVQQPAETDILQARGAVKQLGGALKGELVQAMQSGGPAEAVQVCNHSAPVIADEVSESQGMDVGRTAMRVRNPNNAADEWEKAQMLAFAEAIEAGEDPATLEHAEIISENGVHTFRYMKPIMLGKVCATCHGEQIPPKLEAQIKASYPDDEATGFKPGELRGAFTISKSLSK